MFKSKCLYPHLIHICDYPDGVTHSKHCDQQGQDGRDLLVPPLSVRRLLIGSARLSDGSEQEIVEDCQQDEGDERHHKEVWEEDVVPRVAHALPELGRANSESARPGGLSCVGVTSLQLHEAGNVPNQGGYDDRDDVEFTGQRGQWVAETLSDKTWGWSGSNLTWHGPLRNTCSANNYSVCLLLTGQESVSQSVCKSLFGISSLWIQIREFQWWVTLSYYETNLYWNRCLKNIYNCNIEHSGLDHFSIYLSNVTDTVDHMEPFMETWMRGSVQGKT